MIPIANTENLNLYVVPENSDEKFSDFIQKIAGSDANSNFEILDATIKDLQDEVANFPESLPADGGNADTLEGKSASDFAVADHDHNEEYAPIDHDHDEMVGASANSSGSLGMVPAPKAGNETAFLRGDGTWSTPEGKNYSQGEGIEITSDYQIKNIGVLSVTAGENNGTLNVNGTEVPITGLGSSAFTDINDYAKADHSHEDKMNVSAYDSDGEIAAAGGIAEWIAAHYENAEVNTY